MMKCLVTGGCGFIGSNLVDKLILKGHDVTVVDIKKSNFLNKEAHFIKSSIMDLEKMKELFKGTDFIFHFAANPDVKDSIYNIFPSFELSVKGTLNMLEAARVNNVKNFVFTSSSTVYGITDSFPIKEDSKSLPINFYGATKSVSDIYLCTYANSFDMNCTSLVLANIYGPRSNHGVMFDFYNKLKKNSNVLHILGNGLQKKSYLYIDDVLDAIIIIMNNMNGYQVFNVGSTKWYTVNELADMMCKIMNIKPDYIYSGGNIGWKGDVPKFLLDVSKLIKLGWKEKTSLEDGMKKYINYLKQNHAF